MRTMSPVVKSTPLGFERFLLALVFASERETRSSLNAGSLLTHTFGTATLRVGVLAVGMRIRENRMALLVPLEFPNSFLF